MFGTSFSKACGDDHAERQASRLGIMGQYAEGGGLETGVLICTFNYEGRVPCAAVAPDGRTFVAGDAVGRVYFLRLENG